MLNEQAEITYSLKSRWLAEYLLPIVRKLQ